MLRINAYFTYHGTVYPWHQKVYGLPRCQVTRAAYLGRQRRLSLSSGLMREAARRA